MGATLTLEKNTREEIEDAIEEHRPLIFGYLISQTGDINRAEDLFQEICITIFEKYDQFEKGTNFKAWAMQITKFKILSLYQKQKRDRKMVQLSEALADTLSNEMEQIEEEQQDNENDALRQCLDKLKDKHRALFVERYGENKPMEQIAKSFKMKIDSIYVVLSRLRKTLEQCVSKRLKGA